MSTLKLIIKKTRLLVAERHVEGTVEETKLRILSDLIRRWGLRWEEEEQDGDVEQ